MPCRGLASARRRTPDCGQAPPYRRFARARHALVAALGTDAATEVGVHLARHTIALRWSTASVPRAGRGEGDKNVQHATFKGGLRSLDCTACGGSVRDDALHFECGLSGASRDKEASPALRNAQRATSNVQVSSTPPLYVER